jgi:hypothetical protein
MGYLSAAIILADNPLLFLFSKTANTAWQEWVFAF